jgi:hypothetical protein
MKHILLLCIFTFSSLTLVQAQNQLVVKLNNNASEAFTVSDIRSIKFGSSTMNLYMRNGTVNSWSISDVVNYSFKQATSIAHTTASNNEQLQVFPNPAKEFASIVYVSQKAGSIRLEITDVTGKLIERVYEGEHYGERSYNWPVKAPAGVYFCRVISDAKTITRSFIIQ